MYCIGKVYQIEMNQNLNVTLTIIIINVNNMNDIEINKKSNKNVITDGHRLNSTCLYSASKI